MKKIILIVTVFLGSTCELKAQNDTLAILQNIVANKSNYVGQPFSSLVAQLTIQIKYCLAMPNTKNRYQENLTSFAFFNPNPPNQTYRSYPRLMIKWQSNLDYRKSRYLYYLTNGAWSTALYNFYSNAIIADISILR